MKLNHRILIVLAICLHSAKLFAMQDQSAQVLTLHLSNTSLRETLEQIGAQLEIYFLYEDEIIDQKEISCQFKDQSIDECLRKLLDPFRIQYKRVKAKTFLLFQNNQRQVYGSIYDDVTKEPLPYANVFIPGTYIGTTTDENGKFRLTVPIETESITVQFMGYNSIVIPLYGSTDNFMIPMNPVVIPLQPVETFAEADRDLDHRVNSVLAYNEQIIGIGLTPTMMGSNATALPFVRYDFRPTSDPSQKEKYNPVQYLNIQNMPHFAEQNRIRQGQFRDDLIEVDGIRLYEPYHLKIIPGTNSSIYSVEMMNRSQYSNAGFDAEYSDAMNSMLDLEYNNQIEKPLSGRLNIGILGQDLYLSSGSSSRYSFMAHMKRNNDSNMPRVIEDRWKIAPRFSDLQAKMGIRISDSHYAELFFLQSKDECSYSPVQMNYGNYSTMMVYEEEEPCFDEVNERRSSDSEYRMNIASMQSFHHLGKAELNFRFSLYKNSLSDEYRTSSHVQTTFLNESRFISILEKNEIIDNSWKDEIIDGELEIHFRPSGKVVGRKLGMNFQSIKFQSIKNVSGPSTWQTNLFREWYEGSFDERHPLQTHQITVNEFSQLDIRSEKYSIFYVSQYQLNQKTNLEMGLRWDYYELNDKGSLNPRFKLTTVLSKNILFTGAWGIYTQNPTIPQTLLGRTSPGNKKNQNAIHYVAAVDVMFTRNWSFRIESFHKQLQSVIPINRLGDGQLVYLENTTRADGFTKGFHLNSTYRHRYFSLQCAYTYVKAMEKLEDEYNYYPRINDQRHTLTTILTWPIYKNFNLKLYNYYGSGYPFTPSMRGQVEGNSIWISDSHNSQHYPAYHRLDLMLSQSFLFRYGSLELYLKLINIFDRQNIYAITYSYDEQGQPIEQQKALYGFIPLLGASYTF